MCAPSLINVPPRAHSSRVYPVTLCAVRQGRARPKEFEATEESGGAAAVQHNDCWDTFTCTQTRAVKTTPPCCWAACATIWGVYAVTLSDKNGTISPSKNRLLHLSCRGAVKKICEQMTKWLLWKGQRDVEKDHLVQSELRDVQLWNWLWNTKRPSLLCGTSKHRDLHKQITLIVFPPHLWGSVGKKRNKNRSETTKL